MSEWEPIETAPRDAFALAVCADVVCKHGPGQIVLTGSRMGGDWVFNCEHDIVPRYWIQLPPPPIKETGDE